MEGLNLPTPSIRPVEAINSLAVIQSTIIIEVEEPFTVVLIIVGCYFAVPRKMHPSNNESFRHMASGLLARSGRKWAVPHVPFQQRGDQLPLSEMPASQPSFQLVDLTLRSSVPVRIPDTSFVRTTPDGSGVLYIWMDRKRLVA
ncbi:hypothetical protein VP1G_10715 [Cytospora mali]|uniref:Uncharacterized protein n=1 Tax=Cytospora mali TaxID=578113 RepID=A0A194UTA3_CYTMA|nr:hypothetical protein VP1G_10715 [Valsa mali var. pyri (nom. inval.)]